MMRFMKEEVVLRRDSEAEKEELACSPHSARRWSFTAYRIAMSIPTACSVSASSEAVFGRAEGPVVREEQVKKERERLRHEVPIVVR